MHIDNKNKDILILGEGQTQKLNNTISLAEAGYPINFVQSRKKIVLIPHYNGINSFLFANAREAYQFKAKYSEIKDYTLCLGHISKVFRINNLKQKRLD